MLTIGLMVLALAGCGALVQSRIQERTNKAERSHPPEGRILDVGGVPIHVVEMGTGPDLVLIHGASGNTRDFTFGFAQKMAANYRVLVFDRPGLGYSGRARLEYDRSFTRAAESPSEQAALLAQAAAQLGAEAPIVAGHSYGGAVALAWALDHPLSGLVVISGASNTWEGNLGALYQINSSPLGGVISVPLISALAPKAQVSDVLMAIFEPDPVPEGYAQYIGAGLTLRPESLRANARQVNALKGHLAQMIPRYGEITVSTEIIHGSADTVVGLRIHAEPLATQIPGAVLTTLEGVGHMPHHAAPEAVASAINRAAARAGLR